MEKCVWNAFQPVAVFFNAMVARPRRETDARRPINPVDCQWVINTADFPTISARAEL